MSLPLSCSFRMAAASDSSQLRAQTHGSPSEADYVLLTTAAAAPGEEEEAPAAAAAAAPHFKPVDRPTLPRPRFLPLLQLAALVDMAVALFLGFRVPVWTLPASAVVGNLAKPVVVGAAVSSSRVREHGPIILAQLAVSQNLSVSVPLRDSSQLTISWTTPLSSRPSSSSSA